MSLQYSGYPKVWQLGHKYLEELLLDPVVVQEKVDGSQFSFGTFDGKLRCWSHHQEIDIQTPQKMFIEGVEYLKTVFDRLVPGVVYRSEYLSKPKHNVLTYSRVPRNHLVLFDADGGYENYVAYDTLVQMADSLDIDVIPMVFEGIVKTVQDVEGYLSRQSFLGGCTIEGVVIKNYRRFGVDGKCLMGKYVSEKFKEKAKIEWKVATKDGVVESIRQALNTEARWLKAIQHLREQGLIEDDVRDIGKIMAEVKRDVHEECAEEIRHQLYRGLANEVFKGIGTGIPEWYKRRLLENQFEVKP